MELNEEQQTGKAAELESTDCIYCGKPHELKRSLWVVESARLLEIKAEPYYYCPEANRLIHLAPNFYFNLEG